MAQSFRLASGVDPWPAQRAFASGSDHHGRSARVTASDEELARLTRANVFVVGSDDLVSTFITSLWPWLVTPVASRHHGDPFCLSPTSPPVGTVVIYDVDRLTCEEQRALIQWMDTTNGSTRVVTTASESLLPMVNAGAFNDALYYRLNVVTIDLRAPAVP